MTKPKLKSLSISLILLSLFPNSHSHRFFVVALPKSSLHLTAQIITTQPTWWSSILFSTVMWFNSTLIFCKSLLSLSLSSYKSYQIIWQIQVRKSNFLLWLTTCEANVTFSTYTVLKRHLFLLKEDLFLFCPPYLLLLYVGAIQVRPPLFRLPHLHFISAPLCWQQNCFPLLTRHTQNW